MILSSFILTGLETALVGGKITLVDPLKRGLILHRVNNLEAGSKIHVASHPANRCRPRNVYKMCLNEFWLNKHDGNSLATFMATLDTDK
jgi:hypothetical protein